MAFRKKYFAFVGVALIAAGLLTASVYAQGRPGFHRGGGMTFPLMLRGLNLTDDQKAQVKQLMANHRSTLHDLFSQLRTAREDMSNKLLSPAALQESELTSTNQQIALLRNQIAEESLKMALEIRGVLTPDQLAKAAQLRQQMRSLHSQMRDLWGPKPQAQ